MHSDLDDRDDQVQALFRRIDDGPPLDIDVHDLMARGKRVRARRTGLAVVGSTLAVAGAVVVSLSLAAGSRSPNLVPADPPSVTSTVTSTVPAPQSDVPSGTPGTSVSGAPDQPNSAPDTDNDPPAPSNGDGNADGDADSTQPENVPPPNGPGGGP